MYFDGKKYFEETLGQKDYIFRRYQFAAGNSGTHFWHAHTGLHKMDGIFGSLIIREPIETEPNTDLYDFDLSNHIIVINDWMNEESTERYPGRETGVTGQSANSLLINGKGRTRVSMVSLIVTLVNIADTLKKSYFDERNFYKLVNRNPVNITDASRKSKIL